MTRRPARRGSVTVKVEGLKELEKSLSDLIAMTTSRTGKSAIRRGLVKAAEPMAERMRQLAPVRSGHLRRKIVVSLEAAGEAGAKAYSEAMKAGKSKSEAVTAMRNARRAARNAGETSDLEVYVGPTIGAPHAHLVEFGTSNMAPRPFARPAFEMEKEASIEAVKAQIKTELQKATARAARRAARKARP